MASTDAVNAVCDAIVHILRTSMAEDVAGLGLAVVDPSFAVYQSSDFSNTSSSRHIKSGASVYLYRTLPNLSHRTPSGNLLPNGQRQRSKLPLDLHLLVTIWGETPSTQNRLVGWVLSTLEDYPILPASILNLIGNGRKSVFGMDETVELLLGEMTGEEILQVWDTLASGGAQYQITIPYLVRNVMIESGRKLEIAQPVQSRTNVVGRLGRAAE